MKELADDFEIWDFTKGKNLDEMEQSRDWTDHVEESISKLSDPMAIIQETILCSVESPAGEWKVKAPGEGHNILV